MRDFATPFSGKFLSDYQRGTVAYAYKGIPCQKSPIDLAIYLRLIWDLKPKGVIEIGANAGGSAIWLADTLRAYGLPAPIVSIDVNPPVGVSDPQVTFLRGDALDLGAVLTENMLAAMPHPWLVIEDSAHTFAACSAVLKFFAGAMQAADVLVIEDGVIDDLGLAKTYGGGPNEAVRQYFAGAPGTFEILSGYCDMFGPNATYNPNGYLRKA